MTSESTPAAKKFIEEASAVIGRLLWTLFPLLPAEEKEDIAQEVQLKLWKMIKSGKKIQNLRSYLWKAAYTTALDMVDQKAGTLQMDGEIFMAVADPILYEDVLPIDSALEKKELRLALEKAIDTLPRNRRTVLKLHLTGMDVGEIADFLGWTESKVNHLFYRGRDDLKRRLRTKKRII